MLLDLYLRLSDLRLDDLNDDGESKNLVHAEKRLRELAHREGARVGKVIVENDIRDGKPMPASAYKRKTVVVDGKKVKRVIRPGFTELLDRMSMGLSGGFITVDLDRAVRDPRDLEDLIDVAQEVQANVRSQTGSLRFTDGGTGGEIDQARILVTMANKSSRDTARRVAESRLRQAQSGEWHGGKRPFGFASDGITINAEEAQVIRSVTRAILAGVSLRACTQDLRDRGVPTVKGGKWDAKSLKDILSRPRNAGIMVYRGKELPVKAPWEPIVEVDEFRAVVAKMTIRKAEPGRSQRYLGSGLYFCSCGGKLAGHNQKDREPRYRCKDTGLMGGEHTSRNIRYLDEYITDLIVGWAAQPVAMRRLMPIEETRIDVDGLRAETVALNVRLDQKARDNFLERITDSQLKIFTEMTKERLREIDELLAIARAISPVHDLILAAEGEGDLTARKDRVRLEWDSYSLGHQRLILTEVLSVKAKQARRGHGFDPKSVEIIWLL